MTEGLNYLLCSLAMQTNERASSFRTILIRFLMSILNNMIVSAIQVRTALVKYTESRNSEAFLFAFGYIRKKRVFATRFFVVKF